MHQGRRERLNEMIALFKHSGRGWTVDALAERFGVTTRQVRRDLLVISREMGTGRLSARSLARTEYVYMDEDAVWPKVEDQATDLPAEMESEDEDASGGVYFIQVGEKGPVKIGYSKDIDGRVAQLQTSHFEPLYLRAVLWGAGRAEERRLHEQFDDVRLSGEWFEASISLLRLIDEIYTNDLGEIAYEEESELQPTLL